MPQRLECNTAVLLKRMVYFCHVLPRLCFLSFAVIWNVRNTAQGKSVLVTDDMKEEKMTNTGKCICFLFRALKDILNTF